MEKYEEYKLVTEKCSEGEAVRQSALRLPVERGWLAGYSAVRDCCVFADRRRVSCARSGSVVGTSFCMTTVSSRDSVVCRRQ